MKKIYLLALLFLASCSFQERITTAVPVMLDALENDTKYSFSKLDYFYHISNFTIASDEMDLLLVVRIPNGSGTFSLNKSDVYIADFRGCETKKTGVSLYRGNDLAMTACDADPPKIFPIVVEGEVRNQPKTRWLASYEISLEGAEFEVNGDSLRFRNLSASVKNIRYYGP